ncbi:MAG: hypothetical protein IJ565_03765 [Bacilli bacterium]|nr:hypothetical protein [Bacilli bacterium]
MINSIISDEAKHSIDSMLELEKLIDLNKNLFSDKELEQIHQCLEEMEKNEQVKTIPFVEKTKRK